MTHDMIPVPVREHDRLGLAALRHARRDRFELARKVSRVDDHADAARLEDRRRRLPDTARQHVDAELAHGLSICLCWRRRAVAPGGPTSRKRRCPCRSRATHTGSPESPYIRLTSLYPKLR